MLNPPDNESRQHIKLYSFKWQKSELSLRFFGAKQKESAFCFGKKPVNDFRQLALIQPLPQATYMTCFSFTYASLVGLSRLPYFTVVKLCYINTVHVQDPIYWIHVCYKPSSSLDIIRNMRQVCAFGPRDGRRVTSKKYISAEEDEKCAAQLGVEEFRSRQYPE